VASFPGTSYSLEYKWWVDVSPLLMAEIRWRRNPGTVLLPVVPCAAFQVLDAVSYPFERGAILL